MGADVMTGGAGGDTFVWESIAETGIASADLDTIKDFNAAEGDKINLHASDYVNMRTAREAQAAAANSQL